MKKIRKAELDRKLNRTSPTDKPTPPVEVKPTPPKSDDSAVALRIAKASADAVSRLEATVRSESPDMGVMMRELGETLSVALKSNTVTRNPVAYDLVISRRRDGLMDKVRLIPVVNK